MMYTGFIVKYTDGEGSVRWVGSFKTIQEVNDTMKSLKDDGATNIEYFRLVKELFS